MTQETIDKANVGNFEYKYLLDKIINLAEYVVELKMENEQLKTELKHEKELNKFRTEFPNTI